jgi:hypothetical protein
LHRVPQEGECALCGLCGSRIVIPFERFTPPLPVAAGTLPRAPWL